MENYLLAFPLPCTASLTPGFALFFHVRQNFKGGSLLFIPIFFNHSHLKKQICLRPVITCAWAEQGFLLNSLVCLEGQFEKSHHSMGISTCDFCLSQRCPEVLFLRKSVSPFLLLQSLHIQPLSPPHFCYSTMLDLSSSKLLLFFPLYLKHCCQRTLSKVSASSRSCCDPLNKPPADLPSEQDEV